VILASVPVLKIQWCIFMKLFWRNMILKCARHGGFTIRRSLWWAIFSKRSLGLKTGWRIVRRFALIPEDIFYYIYAIFHSPQYRQRYAEFLKIDFPRVPLTSNKQLFWDLATKGDRLVQLHLMKATGTAISSYPIDGSNIVEQVKYNETQQQISINSEQYFGDVPPHIWNFYIGGYQVCQKWLKDRKNRALNFDDLMHYQNIIAILGETITIMNDIDQIILKHGGFPFT
jgi:hypothetical protein